MSLVNQKDGDNRTALFYAVYYNYENLVLYLLTKGADPYLIDGENQNIFHVIMQYGRFKCLQLIMNYERHELRVELFKLIHINMKKLDIKKSDIK